MKCANCWRQIETMPDVIYNQWLKLVFYFDHEYSEGEISQETYEDMVDSLMAIKPKELEVKDEPED